VALRSGSSFSWIIRSSSRVLAFLSLRIRVYAAKIVLDDPYRPLGRDWWKWKKSSGSYLCLTRSNRS
jgi:hypothetical protein